MPRVTDEYRQAKKTEIIAAAMRVLERQGVSRTSMNDIIAESGMSAGAIYSHFRSKAELAATIGETVMSAQINELRKLPSRDPEETLRTSLRLVARRVRRNEMVPRIVLQFWAEATTDETLRAVMVTALKRQADMFRRAISDWAEATCAHPDEREKELDRVARCMVSLSQGYLLRIALFDNVDPDLYVDSIRMTLAESRPVEHPDVDESADG